jgi:hypothetical protein
MGKSDRRSRDQKRKARLKKRAERSGKHESLAYHGRKYKTDAFVGIIHATEVGIHEADVISDRTLTDDAVEAALESLIIQLRQRAMPVTGQTGAAADATAARDDLLEWNIRQNWARYAEQKPLPRREDLVGVLRTILGSLEFWRAESVHARGYLEFVEGFLKQTGVSVRKVGPEEAVYLEDNDEEDRLLDLGRDWIDDGDEDTAHAFSEEEDEALAAGETERVREVCRRLVDESMHEPEAAIVFQAALACAEANGSRAIESRSEERR